LLFTLEDRLRERKREQTFLSIDVAGSTRMKEGEDPLAIEYSFRNYHRFVTRIVHVGGGKVYSSSGAGVLAAFERPQDSARAAVYAWPAGPPTDAGTSNKDTQDGQDGNQ